ncbi:hypothetical protein WG902_11195 [Ramlibacter sp. PS3R-8]|uniref:hypothetical protein n=1 Tax=Ramlibacter sp. PS3R-8 TaxID=3133437 RepID=UPI0030953BF2
MTIEVPVLRLGLAGYSEAQQKAAADVARSAVTTRCSWEIVPFAEADAWWLEGSRTMLLPNQHLRVQPAVPSHRSVQLALADVDRPVAFSLPLTAEGFNPAVTFQLNERAEATRVLQQFASWMKPTLAQFALATSIADHQPTLGSGSWEVLRGSDLLAVVDLKLGAGVAPDATAAAFEEASWCIRNHGDVVIPPNFSRVSVSQLMWQYAQRTERDLLPSHYRAQPLYFRRPPRLAQRFQRDGHLLVMRELVAKPGLTFADLQQSTGMNDSSLARCLSALYVVGSITSNPRRANLPASGAPGTGGDSHQHSQQSSFNSVMDSAPRTPELVRSLANDKTAPAPLKQD